MPKQNNSALKTALEYESLKAKIILQRAFHHRVLSKIFKEFTKMIKNISNVNKCTLGRGTPVQSKSKSSICNIEALVRDLLAHRSERVKLTLEDNHYVTGMEI